ncbi:MAG: phosphohistidine phosphatase SixA [Bdellovibrionales bacterium]|nr:phosphohistidine phosphatase SixA [Bdellovibrionales bacterium]
MQLILIRHGIAQDRKEFAETTKLEDAFRPLTIKGRKKMQKIAVELKDWVPKIDLIVSSPYTRAKQTAEIVARVFNRDYIKEASELVPHSPPNMFLQWLKAHGRSHQTIIAVGHEPQMSALASYLMTGKTESVLMLKKSGLACLQFGSWADLEPGVAELVWLIQPRQIAG